MAAIDSDLTEQQEVKFDLSLLFRYNARVTDQSIGEHNASVDPSQQPTGPDKTKTLVTSWQTIMEWTA